MSFKVFISLRTRSLNMKIYAAIVVKSVGTKCLFVKHHKQKTKNSRDQNQAAYILSTLIWEARINRLITPLARTDR